MGMYVLRTAPGGSGNTVNTEVSNGHLVLVMVVCHDGAMVDLACLGCLLSVREVRCCSVTSEGG